MFVVAHRLITSANDKLALAGSVTQADQAALALIVAITLSARVYVQTIEASIKAERANVATYWGI